MSNVFSRLVRQTLFLELVTVSVDEDDSQFGFN